MMTSSFMVPVRKDAEPAHFSRTSASEFLRTPSKKDEEISRNEKPKGPSFQELLSRPEEKKEAKSEKAEKNVGATESSGKKESVSKKAVTKQETGAEAAHGAKAKAEPQDENLVVAKNNGEQASVKDKLLKEISQFLEQNKENIRFLKNNGGLENGKMDLEKMGVQELKDLLDRLKTDLNALFQARILTGAQKDEKQQPKLPVKEQAVQELTAKESAFHVQESAEGPRILVNKDKVQVVDKRMSTEHPSQELKTTPESQKQGSLTDEILKKDSPTITRNEVSGFKDLMEKREAVEVSAKNLAKEVKDTNRVFHDVVQQSKLMIQDKKSLMQLDLKPEHLGRVTLKIEVVDNKVMATVFAQNEGTGDMFRQNMQNMQNAFKDAGLELQGLQVNVGTSDRDFREMLDEQPGEAEKSLSNIPELTDEGNEDLSSAAVGYSMARWAGFQRVDYVV